jgi:hypothetical protein
VFWARLTWSRVDRTSPFDADSNPVAFPVHPQNIFLNIFIHPKNYKIIQGIFFLTTLCIVLSHSTYSHESKSGSMNCVRGFGCPNCPQFGCIRQKAMPITEVTFLVTFLFRNLFEGGDGGGHEAAGKRCP